MNKFYSVICALLVIVGSLTPRILLAPPEPDCCAVCLVEAGDTYGYETKLEGVSGPIVLLKRFPCGRTHGTCFICQYCGITQAKGKNPWDKKFCPMCRVTNIHPKIKQYYESATKSSDFKDVDCASCFISESENKKRFFVKDFYVKLHQKDSLCFGCFKEKFSCGGLNHLSNEEKKILLESLVRNQNLDGASNQFVKDQIDTVNHVIVRENERIEREREAEEEAARAEVIRIERERIEREDKAKEKAAREQQCCSSGEQVLCYRCENLLSRLEIPIELYCTHKLCPSCVTSHCPHCDQAVASDLVFTAKAIANSGQQSQILYEIARLKEEQLQQQERDRQERQRQEQQRKLQRERERRETEQQRLQREHNRQQEGLRRQRELEQQKQERQEKKERAERAKRERLEQERMNAQLIQYGIPAGAVLAVIMYHCWQWYNNKKVKTGAGSGTIKTGQPAPFTSSVTKSRVKKSPNPIGVK